MKKYILKILIVTVLFISTDRFAGYMISTLAEKRTSDERIGLITSGRLDAEIIILGSSRALNNYSPAVITETTGKTCYNLGVSGSNIIFHETLLDVILNSGNLPSVIIYNVDDNSTFYDIPGVVYRKDVLFPFINNPVINRSICSELDKDLIISDIIMTYRQNVNLVPALSYLTNGKEPVDYKTTNFNEMGANLLDMQPDTRVPDFGKAKLPAPPESMKMDYVDAFNRIQEKCKAANIRLILTLPPLFTYSTPGFAAEIQKRRLEDVAFIDLTGTMKEKRYFFNRDHMNRAGALVYSAMVGEELNKLLQ